MQLVDNILSKFGSDKVLHFAIGGWIVALFSLFGLLSTAIGVGFTLVISFIKERFLDDAFDSGDIKAAMLGALVSVAVYVLSWLF